MQNTSHLTPIPNAVRIAWHSEHNYQAVRIGTDERLYIAGRHVPLARNMHNPVQIVINACASGMSAADLLAVVGETIERLK